MYATRDASLYNARPLFEIYTTPLEGILLMSIAGYEAPLEGILLMSIAGYEAFVCVCFCASCIKHYV